MGRRYADELAELFSTYETVVAASNESLSEIVRVQRELNRRSAYFVGSGGAIAMAQLAATVHGGSSRYSSQAVTPLSLTMGQNSRISNAGIALFSARARHPDVKLAARAARSQPGNYVVLLTQLNASDVDAGLTAAVDEVVTLPSTSRDGFLATNSILAMATAWLKAAGFDLPKSLPLLDATLPRWPAMAKRALVLYGPDQRAAAYDLEARLSETGLLDVQLADLRNMAHGRHVGLIGRSKSTAVITLGDPRSQALVEKTIAALPSNIERVDLSSGLHGPVGALDALVGCMRLVGAIAEARTGDPGRPHVSPSGRLLYHLPWTRLANGPDGLRPPRLKAMAAGFSPSDEVGQQAWADAWKVWKASTRGRTVRAVVVDYDGTCVSTSRRTSPPLDEVQVEVVRLLELGVRFCVASGRGPSVAEELRRWIPEKYWGATLLGIYNGGVIKPLSEVFERATESTGELKGAAELLDELLVGDGWKVTPRPWQVTIEREGASGADTASCVSSILMRAEITGFKIVTSGHSVDVIPVRSSKRRVIEALDLDPEEIMSIGDRGEPHGNDFELLSCTSLSLSVDRVSADPQRCWNLSEDGTSGPALLARYLRALQSSRAGLATFSWKSGTRR